jgi:LysW-gamma-L-lysine carboxypeptidase
MTLVEKLVREYSPSGREANVVKIFLNALSQKGFKTECDLAGNAIARIGKGKTHIALVGHIDTVPGNLPVRIKDDILYGRGSVDAKGCLATFAEAASQFADSNKIKLTLVGCVREETDSYGAYYLQDTLYPPDFVIIGEPSGWDGITLGYRGAMSLEYQFEGSRHHHGAPELTAAEEAIQFYQSIQNRYPELGAHFTMPDLRIGKLNTYERKGQVGVKMQLDMRTPPEFNFSELKNMCSEYQNGATLEFGKAISAVLTNKQNPLVRSFLGAIRSKEGTPRFKRKTGTADMNILAEWGCPIVAYGPGDSALDHTVNEHLYLEEYNKSINVLTNVLEKLERI